jgi:hypothetical protein
VTASLSQCLIVAERLRDLKDLPERLPLAGFLVDNLVRMLTDDGIFEGEIWDGFDVGEYVMENYLPANLNENLEFELEDVIASSNAYFPLKEFVMTSPM